MDDARIAVETGVDGVDVVIGTSSFLREHSHGKDMTYILKVGLFNLRHFRSPLLSGSEADRYIQFITLTLIITSSLPHSPSPSPSLSLAYVLEYSD